MPDFLAKTRKAREMTFILPPPNRIGYDAIALVVGVSGEVVAGAVVTATAAVGCAVDGADVAGATLGECMGAGMAVGGACAGWLHATNTPASISRTIERFIIKLLGE